MSGSGRTLVLAAAVGSFELKLTALVAAVLAFAVWMRLPRPHFRGVSSQEPSPVAQDTPVQNAATTTCACSESGYPNLRDNLRARLNDSV